MAWFDRAFQRRTVQLALGGLLVLVLALMLGPRLWTRDSILDELQVGSRADKNIKATRDFDYMPSDEKLEQERSAAVEKILPVLDHQTDMGTVIISRINQAFAEMLSADLSPLPAKSAGRADRSGSEAPGARSARARPPGGESKEGATSKGAREAKAGAPGTEPAEDVWESKRRRFSEILQAEVPPDTFDVLRKANFSPELRSSLLAMVGATTNQLIISHRGVLASYKGAPVRVRHLVAGRVGPAGEEVIERHGRFKDLQQIRDEIGLQGKLQSAKHSPEVVSALVKLARRLIGPNVTYNRGETESRREAARQKVKPRPISLVKGQVILRDGDPITQEHIAMIRAMEAWGTRVSVFQEILGVGFFVLLVLAVVFRFAAQQFKRFYRRPRDLLAMGLLLVGLLGLIKGVVSMGGGLARGQDLPVFYYVIPIAAGAMLIRLLISAEAAALFAVVLSALAGLLLDRNLGMTLFFLVTSLVGSFGLAQVQSRSTVLRSGLLAGLAGGALLLGMRLFQGQLIEVSTLYAFLGATAGGLLASFMTLALLPAIEWLFAYTTDVTLLELANLNHPLLRDLILRAPGTYHHSMIVGSLSEAACDSIGANGLLARVASYYHDIGKSKNADYFAENFKRGDNPHNRLKPSMSALIIRSHVKDTVEMLREHGIPELVIDTATQHHGKTLIEFFYHKAGDQKEDGEEVREEDYRYPGPKPQSREAGVIMLADGVEAAARSLATPTEDRLRTVVQRVINGKFTDGQLDHCDVTLRDLHLIAKSFLQVLRGIYHQRPTYPWQQGRRDEAAPGAGKGKPEREDPAVDRGEEQAAREGRKRRTGTHGAVDGGDGRKRKNGSQSARDEPDRARAEGGRTERAEGGRTERTEGGRTERTERGRTERTERGKTERTERAGKGRKRKSGPHDELERGKGRKRKQSSPQEPGPVAREAAGDHDNGEAEISGDLPASAGTGPEGLEPGSAKEAPTESSKDIKRLGLG